MMRMMRLVALEEEVDLSPSFSTPTLAFPSFYPTSPLTLGACGERPRKDTVKMWLSVRQEEIFHQEPDWWAPLYWVFQPPEL